MKNKLIAGLSLFLAACASSKVEDARQSNLTAGQHRAEAVREEEKAEQYEERKLQQMDTEMGSGNSVIDSRALAHKQKAEAHQKAAEGLERTAAAECVNVDPHTYCPLEDANVSKEVISTPHGVRIVLDSSSIGGVEDVTAHVRCHIAYSRAYGVTDASCPLYMRGIEAAVSGTDRATVISLESPNPKDALLIQAWSAKLSKPKE